jgi:Cdc6-like AAA superfamily ATPase
MPEETTQELSLDEKFRLRTTCLKTFTPGRPLTQLDLLAGRGPEIIKVIEAVVSPGQHAAIFGERGVGKSSLANLISDMVFASGKEGHKPATVTCSTTISFTDIWRSAFRTLGLNDVEVVEELGDSPNSENVRHLFSKVEKPSIVVIDEFDRVEDLVSSAMSDTIKTLSDRDVPTTLVIVGVADSVEQLILGHRSIDRALIQVQMPRMSRDELMDIVTKGMARMPELNLDVSLAGRMAGLCKGLPHFAHLLAKHSVLTAIESGHRIVARQDYEKALKTATEEKTQTLGEAYRDATHSAKESVFEEVLLACALSTDEQGRFGAKDVRAPLSYIMNKPVKIEAYIRHLDKFSQEARGPVLKKDGQKRRFQYSFVEPMMQPYVLMKGLADGKITEERLSVLSSAPEPLYEQSLFGE